MALGAEVVGRAFVALCSAVVATGVIVVARARAISGGSFGADTVFVALIATATSALCFAAGSCVPCQAFRTCGPTPKALGVFLVTHAPASSHAFSVHTRVQPRAVDCFRYK